MPDDPYAFWRHLDGQRIAVRTHELVEDVDGSPSSVVAENHWGVLCLPPLTDDQDDDG